MDFDNSIAFLPQWLRPPTWRWAAATQIAASYSPHTKTMPSEKTLKTAGYEKDSALLTAAKYYRIARTVKLGGMKAAKAKYPNMYRASLIFKGQNHYTFWKMSLEAMLLTKLSLEDIATKLGIAKDIDILRLYRKVFFDVDPSRDSEAAIQMNVIAMASKGENLEPTQDYLSKMIAYIKGYDTFYRLFISRNAHMLTDDDSEWIRNVIHSQIGMKALSVAASKRTEYITEHLDLLKTGREWLERDPDDVDMLGQKAKTESVATLLESVHEVLDRGQQAATDLTSTYTEYMNVDWSNVTDTSGYKDDKGDIDLQLVSQNTPDEDK